MSAPPSVHVIETSIHGRYLVARPDGPGPHPLMVGFHGYGENAVQHLVELNRLPGAERWLRVSVLALHRFYTRAGEIVGCWMTRQDREPAIADNVAYVRAVVIDVARQWPTNGRPVYVGFSQGASMAWRAAALAGHPCRGVIALAGDIPPELRSDPAFTLPDALIGCGTRDHLYTEDKQQTDVEALTARGVTVEAVRYDGGHGWTDEFRLAAGRFLSRLDGPGG